MTIPPPLRIGLVHPGPKHVRGGNRTTALRWMRILRSLGSSVFVEGRWDGRPCDVLVALNAWKSGGSIRRFRRAHPDRPLVVAITGTDLYTDGPTPGELEEALASATRIVVLQENALAALASHHRARARVIHQSVRALPDSPRPRADLFEVCVVANLRPVKDPLLAARAARLLPDTSAIRVLLVGGLLDEGLRPELERELAENARFRWLGEQRRRATLERIASSRLLVSSSHAEGGGEVVSEALAHSVPVLATDIPGSRGMLPEDYPGLFPVGDAPALANLLHRAETDRAFLDDLVRRCRSRAAITDPEREVERWRALLEELHSAS